MWQSPFLLKIQDCRRSFLDDISFYILVLPLTHRWSSYLNTWTPKWYFIIYIKNILYLRNKSSTHFTNPTFCFQSPTPPQYVFWYHNSNMINYDTSRGGISVETLPGHPTQSRLTITDTHESDSGNYTCSASNTEPASIYVYVSEGKECQSNKRTNYNTKAFCRWQCGCNINAKVVWHVRRQSASFTSNSKYGCSYAIELYHSLLAQVHLHYCKILMTARKCKCELKWKKTREIRLKLTTSVYVF